jgi:NADPH-dependent 2,4-dienoyl-CoA reductase/sulfur reductase-like enzyme
LKGVQGLYSKQDLELMEENTAGISKAVIVGGGLIGIEMAEMLRSRNIAVDFLIREKNYWSSVLPTEESEMVSRHIKEHHINLITETELQEIIGDENGFVKDIITKEGKNIECQFVGLTVGVFPNVDFLRNTEFSIDKGILINEFFETNVSDVYSAGDCAQFLNPKEKHPAIEQLWYTGKMQGENLAQIICGNKIAYQRGIWFNSAKFLNIEYQTYGLMFKQPVDEDDTFYWEHLNGKIAMRANFNKTDFSLTGLNFMGMRFRQAVAEQWIIDKTPIFEVIKNLDKGFFDPEFYTNHHNAIKNTFTTQYSSLTNS